VQQIGQQRGHELRLIAEELRQTFVKERWHALSIAASAAPGNIITELVRYINRPAGRSERDAHHDGSHARRGWQLGLGDLYTQ